MEKATTPEELPRLVTEAWNARRADWLAALFEDDADFVNVVGIWWESRPDISASTCPAIAMSTPRGIPIRTVSVFGWKYVWRSMIRQSRRRKNQKNPIDSTYNPAMARIYRLTRSQQLSCDIHTAWAFFCIPANLARITPPDMKFTVGSDNASQPAHQGMVVDFRVTPLFGIPLRWQSRITQVDAPRSFTDVQTKGPYRLWRHRHEYIENGKGILVRDTVDYQLPFGWLGRLAHGSVRKKLEKLFDYRHQVLGQLFGAGVSR